MSDNREYEPLLYTAGRMVWQNDEDSSWRRSLKPHVDGVEFFHPHETYFDHGGDIVAGCVTEDIMAIERADGVVAFFDKPDQVGTLVELMHSDGPALVFVHPRLVAPDPDQQEHGLPLEVTRGVFMRGDSRHLWFLINYLIGDTERHAPEKPFTDEWPGRPDTEVWIANHRDTSAVVEAWANRAFGTGEIDGEEW